MDPLGGDTLSEQVGIRVARRGEEQVGELVGDQAIDLFGHGAVARAQPGLDVRDRHLELGAHEGTRQGRVDVADDEHPRWPPLLHDALEGDHRARRLLGVRAAADAEEDVGLRQLQVLEEDLGHLVVVVLPGVHEQLLEAVGMPAASRP